MKTLQEIQKALPSLSTAEVEKLLAVLQSRLRLEGERSARGKLAPNTGESLAYDTIRAELLSRGLIPGNALHHRAFTEKHRDGPAFDKAALGAEKWLAQHVGPGRLLRQRFWGLAARLIVERARQRPDQPLWRRVAWALDDLPGLVDKAYPGYAASGLLPRLFVPSSKKEATDDEFHGT